MINAYLSQKLKAFSWMGALLVVLIHIPHPFYGDRSLSYWIVDVFLDSITRFAVPFFFCCSGLLLARDYESSFKWWMTSVLKRAKSLLLPYLIANGIMTLYRILRTVVGGYVFDRGADVVVVEILHVFNKAIGWNLMFFPLVGSTWFIRNLFILVLISPVLFYALRNRRCVGVIALCLFGALWMSPLSDIQFFRLGFSLEALFWFSLGAVVGVKRASYVFSKDKRVAVLGTLLLCGGIVLGAIPRACDVGVLNWFLRGGGILFGLGGCWVMYDVLQPRLILSLTPYLSPYSFWIYLYQFAPLIIICSLINYIPAPNSKLAWIVVVLEWSVVSGMLIWLGHWLRKNYPQTWAKLNGGRS